MWALRLKDEKNQNINCLYPNVADFLKKIYFAIFSLNSANFWLWASFEL